MICSTCPRNVLELARHDALANVILQGQRIAGLALSLFTLGLLVRRVRRASGPQRRAAAPVLWAGSAMFAALALSVGNDIVDGPLSSLADWLRACAFASIAIAVLDEGLRAAQQIRARWPQVGILVLSQHVQARYAVELLAAGTEGVGYLLKDRVSDLAELSASVRRVGSGGSALDPAVVAQLVGQRRKADTPLEELTERELDVLALMAEGRSNKAIAERLCDDAAMTGSRP